MKHCDINPTQDIVNEMKVTEYAERLKVGEKLLAIEVYEVPGKGIYIFGRPP